MRLWHLLAFIKDLIDVLPSRSGADWTEVDSLKAHQPTVVLVSGFAATRRNLSVMRRRFEKDGFNVLIVALDWTSMSDGVRGLYRMAEKLAATMVQLKKRSDLRNAPIYLVAHSAGGLVARYYIQLLGGFHYCEGLITLATPHQGTWVASLGFVTHLLLKARCLFQMLPISPFIRRINRAEFPAGFPFLSVSSPQDLMCRSVRARLPKTLRGRPEVRSVQVHGLSHSSFLLNKHVYALCRDAMRGPEHASSVA